MAEEKSVSHFWELGGGRALVQLLDVAITADSMPHTLVVLTIDLARLSRVTDDAAFYLGLVRQRCDAVLAEMRSQGKSALAAQLVANARKRFGEQHADMSANNTTRHNVAQWARLGEVRWWVAWPM